MSEERRGGFAKPGEGPEEVQRRVEALAAAGVDAADVHAECAAILAALDDDRFGFRSCIYSEGERQWVLLEVTSMLATALTAMRAAGGVLATRRPLGGRLRPSTLIDVAVPAALAEMERISVIIDSLPQDAERAARVGVEAAFAAWLDEAVQYPIGPPPPAGGI